MKKLMLSITLLGAITYTACTTADKTNEQSQTITTTEHPMENLVSIIEIPTADLKRAIKFYSTILSVKMDEAKMGDVKMGIFPAAEGTVNVVLVHGSDYKPTTNGPLLYLNGGNDLQAVLDKIEPNGGKILVAKTAISPDMGCYALFADTEGNKLGLHSYH